MLFCLISSNWRSSWTVIREKIRAVITYIWKLEVRFCLYYYFFFWTNCNVNQGRHNCGINKSFFRVISKSVKKMDRYLFKSSPRIIAKNYLLRNLNEILRDENFYIKDKYWLKAFRWGWARLLHWLFVIYWWGIFISFRFCFVIVPLSLS